MRSKGGTIIYKKLCDNKDLNLFKQSLWVFIGAGTGGVLRFWIATWLPIKQGDFPLATLLANASGCFLIGLVMGYCLKNDSIAHWRPLLVTGFLGGYTTFSSFTWETLSLIHEAEIQKAISYVFLSLVACFIGNWIGYTISLKI